VIPLRKTMIATAALIITISLMVPALAGPAEAAKAVKVELYYDGDLVDALIPQKGKDGGSVTFEELPDNANAYPFDPIYVFVDENTNMPHAQNPLIGSVPGDSDYTGGRWHVHLVFGTTAADDDITSVADLMSSGLTIESTDMYFACPVVGK
jgi:hypothetical protein